MFQNIQGLHEAYAFGIEKSVDIKPFIYLVQLFDDMTKQVHTYTTLNNSITIKIFILVHH